MPRPASVASVIEKNRIASEYAYVALLEVDVKDLDSNVIAETLYIARNSENLTYRGQEYAAGSFEFSLATSANEVPEITVSVPDYTRALISRVDAYNGGVGFVVRILVVNTGNLDLPPEIEEQFYVLSSTIQQWKVDFTLGARNPLRMRFPRRMQFRDRCAWVYKGLECGYAGPESFCDYTLQGANGCAVKGNERRYGGFPGLKSRNGL